MDLYGTREAKGFPRQSLDTCTQRQVVTLNTLRKNLTRKVLVLRDFSCITAPVVTGNHTYFEGSQQ